jgi:glycosyltransferase involved in cell wall biosynthesis
VLHVSSGLGIGGAELMLERLVSSADPRSVASGVLSLGARSEIGDRIAASGVPVWAAHANGWRRFSDIPFSLRSALVTWKPDVIQGWMYHGNVAATLLSHCLGRRIPVGWSIRQSLYDVSKEKPGTRIAIWAGRVLSGTPSFTIYNSREAADSHARLGFSRQRQLMIPNGFDCDRFVPNPSARARVRLDLAIPESELVIGHVARYHPVKGHALFIEAASSVAERLSSVTFVLAGAGVDSTNQELTDAIRKFGLKSRVRLLGLRTDIPDLTAAFDIAAVSSHAESFPNVVAEAMACEVPVVATDVGDCASIIGDTGLVCPAGDASALASAMLSLAALSPRERQSLGRQARMRIRTQYGLEQIAQRYWEVYSFTAIQP